LIQQHTDSYCVCTMMFLWNMHPVCCQHTNTLLAVKQAFIALPSLPKGEVSALHILKEL
jgi:hypothetical protein